MNDAALLRLDWTLLLVVAWLASCLCLPELIEESQHDAH